MSTKQQILESDDLRRETLTVKEWGDAKLYLSTLTAGERIGVGTLSNKYPEEPWNAVLIVCNARDESGELIFSEGDISALARKSSEVLNRIARKIEELNGIGQVASEAEKKV